MRVYSMHKGEFVMVFIAFFACFGLGVFIGLAGKRKNHFTILIGRGEQVAFIQREISYSSHTYLQN